MKRAILFCLILIFCFSLFSCESKTANQSNESGVTDCPPLPSDNGSDNESNSSSDGVSNADGIIPEDKVYVFDVCADSFSEDALKETIDVFQRYGTPFTVKQGKDISFSLDGKISKVMVQGVHRVDGNDIDAELDGGIYLLVSSTLDSSDKSSTITVDTDWWYDMSSEDPHKNYPLWSYIIHAEYADGTNRWYYLRANFLNDSANTAFSGTISYYLPHSDILSKFAISGDAAEFLLNILNNGNWKNGVCEGVPDRIINVGDKRLEYCSGCGVINLTKEGKSLALVKDSRQAIWLDSILQINEG